MWRYTNCIKIVTLSPPSRSSPVPLAANSQACTSKRCADKLGPRAGRGELPGARAGLRINAFCYPCCHRHARCCAKREQHDAVAGRDAQPPDAPQGRYDGQAGLSALPGAQETQNAPGGMAVRSAEPLGPADAMSQQSDGIVAPTHARGPPPGAIAAPPDAAVPPDAVLTAPAPAVASLHD